MPILNFLTYESKTAPTVQINTANVLAVSSWYARSYMAGGLYGREIYLKDRDYLTTVWSITAKGEKPDAIMALDTLGGRPHAAVARLHQYGSTHPAELAKAKQIVIATDTDDILMLRYSDVALGRAKLSGLFTASADEEGSHRASRLHHALLKIGVDSTQPPVAVAHTNGAYFHGFRMFKPVA